MRKYFLLCTIVISSVSLHAVPGDSSCIYPEKTNPRSVKELFPRTGSDTSYVIPFLRIHVGGAVAFTNGTTRLDSENLQGTEIDTEEDLGLSKVHFMPRLNLFLRLGKKNNIIFDVYGIRRRNTETISKDIRYGDVLFPSGSSVNSRFRLITYHLTYRNSFLGNRRYDIGAMVGVSLVDYNLRLRSGVDEKKEGLWRPFPVVGLDGYIYLTRNTFIRGVVKFFALPLTHSNYALVSIKPSLEYYFSERIGVGFRYHFSHFYLQDSDTGFDGSIRYQFHAISLFTCFRFF